MKVIIVSIAILIIAGLSYVVYNSIQKDEVDAVDTNTIQLDTIPKTVKPTVTVPEGWEPVEGSVLDFQYAKDTASFIMKTENFDSTNLEAVIPEAKAIFEDAFDNVEFIGNTEDLQVDGRDAKKIVFTIEMMGVGMKYMYIYTVADGDVYAITFGDLSSTFDNSTSDYQTILESIRF